MLGSHSEKDLVLSSLERNTISVCSGVGQKQWKVNRNLSGRQGFQGIKSTALMALMTETQTVTTKGVCHPHKKYIYIKQVKIPPVEDARS